MYKSKKGTLILNINSWHVKFLEWMWNFPIANVNACPYYWTIVLSLHMFPIAILAKYIIFPFCSLFIPLIEKLEQSPSIKFPKIKLSESFVYKKSLKILKALAFVFIVVFLIFNIGIIVILTPKLWFYILLGGVLYMSSGVLFFINDYDMIIENYYEPVIDLFTSIVRIISIPCILLGDLFSWIYQNNCPPIVWEKN